MGFIYCVARGLQTIPCAAIRQSHWLTIHFVFSFVENRLGAFSSTIKMGSLFQLRRDHDIIVVETECEFFRSLAKIYDSQPLMQAQADHHQDIDLQLVTAIDNLLVPHLAHVAPISHVERVQPADIWLLIAETDAGCTRST